MKFAQIISKFCQILNAAFRNGQSFLTVCQSGEISPNVVTLWPSAEWMMDDAGAKKDVVVLLLAPVII